MKQFGIFISTIVVFGAFVGGLVLFPSKTALVAPANVGEGLLSDTEEIIVPTSTFIEEASSTPLLPASTTTHETSTPAVLKPTSTSAISTNSSKKLEVAVSPVFGMQGEPAQIIFSGANSVSDIASIIVNGVPLSVFSYKNKIQAVYGIDIAHKIGDFPIIATLKDGTTIRGGLAVLERKKPTLAFTIPDSLGGTNPVGEQNVATLLSKENAMLLNLETNPKKLWTESFEYPTKNAIVTDPYGYNRDTGTQTVTHKGTDFRAPLGTPVYAANRGVVRLVHNFSIYGKTVIIDHGQGILTFYMHLSKISVSQGSVINRGDKLGESGGTGYAEGPHLHLTVRANGTSIDPMKFFSFYGPVQ